MQTKIKPRIIEPYKNLDNRDKIEFLRKRFNTIFSLFSADDFEHPVTSKQILVALNNIKFELTKLIRK